VGRFTLDAGCKIQMHFLQILPKKFVHSYIGVLQFITYEEFAKREHPGSRMHSKMLFFWYVLFILMRAPF